MAFASIGGNFQTDAKTTAKFVRLHGQMYHNISSLHPQVNNSKRYGQLYILDSEDAVNERIRQLTHQALDKPYFQYSQKEICHLTLVSWLYPYILLFS